ncbi:MAG: hypothetical protein Q4E05_08610, partial [Pseudoclavibacter sp.]|nr:hypothetical protein [Pseudoclavibacter sp.]
EQTGAGERASGAEEIEMRDHEWQDDEIRAAWIQRTERIGTAAAPLLEVLVEDVPEVLVASLATGDGFHLCSIGLHEQDVGRFSALGSSLQSVARAVTGALPDVARNVRLDAVSLRADDVLLVYVTIEHPELGAFIVSAAARGISLGELQMETARAASRLAEELREL